MSTVNKIVPYVFPLILVGGLILYYYVDPIQTNFPIRCPLQFLSGAQCPSCGFQRSLHTLLLGDISRAISYNFFFVISIPYALLAIIVTWYNHGHVFDKLRTFVYHRYTLRSYVILYFGWWIIRNIYNI